jgi:hypothetical protein
MQGEAERGQQRAFVPAEQVAEDSVQQAGEDRHI